MLDGDKCYDIVDNKGGPVADVYPTGRDNGKNNAECLAKAVQACCNIAPILRKYRGAPFKQSKREFYKELQSGIFSELDDAIDEFFKMCDWLPY